MSLSTSDDEGAATAVASSIHARIIKLNDQLRTTFRGGQVQMAPSVYYLDARLRGRALFAMSRLRKFAKNSQHDWGRFIFAGYAFEWRIEYRRQDGTGVSPDPADPDKTFRVLTLSTVDDLLIRRASGFLTSPPA